MNGYQFDMTLGLTSQFAEKFPRRVRLKGTNYYMDGKIDVLFGDDHDFLGFVEGRNEYEVTLSVDSNDHRHTLKVSCTCPYYESGFLCKHIWSCMALCDDREYCKIPDDNSTVELERKRLGDFNSGLIKYAASACDDKQEKTATPEQTLQKAVTELNDFVKMYSPAEHDNPVVFPEEPRPIEVRYELQLNPSMYARIHATSEFREIKKNGEWGGWKAVPAKRPVAGMSRGDFLRVSSLQRMSENYHSYGYNNHESTTALYNILPELCDTGRLFVSCGQRRFGPVKWDGDNAWSVKLNIDHAERDGHYCLNPRLERDGEWVSPEDLLDINESGLLVWEDRLSRLQRPADYGWISYAVNQDRVEFSKEQAASFLIMINKTERLPAISFPDDFPAKSLTVKPTPVLKMERVPSGGDRSFFAQLCFDYDGHEVDGLEKKPFVMDATADRMWSRDDALEQQCWTMMRELGAGRISSWFPGNCSVPSKNFTPLIETALKAGWRVLIKNKPYRHTGGLSTSVRSGIDWFDVQVQCNYGDQSVGLPQLLKAFQEKQNWIELKDGSIGMLPIDWLKKYEAVLSLGSVEDDHLRFRNNQAALLDIWLQDLPNVDTDKQFNRLRSRLKKADEVKPLAEPSGFKGTLRDYQQDGLGWLQYLSGIQMGGCLADDMGLGKTIQALAMLRKRMNSIGRKPKKDRRPSLVVAPKSLIFNWIREAEQFTPGIRILNYTGPQRKKDARHIAGFHLVVTTYATMRQDIGLLKTIQFDYIILDESQMIKNAAAQTFKAACLLRGDQRLALSGTPIENHLGELWSLFEFLNPGFLGRKDNFNRRWVKNDNAEQRSMLSQAVRPFILRRTKNQVAGELPERQEETLFCEMTSAQKKIYEEMQKYYRQNMMTTVKKKGLNKSKIMIIEALLRMRQAACHPGLLDKRNIGTPTAKFETLLPMLDELREENNKALIFSQFTSYLTLLKNELKKRNIVYEYLDGKTRKRDEKVDRFQHDPECTLFLISLKAGGVGLNLTAAEYVFIMDPWWNPAVEAQAIDRTHRIGQTKKVIAYRLIAENTVESKILELQSRKKELTASIIGDHNALLKNISYEELAYLMDMPQT